MHQEQVLSVGTDQTEGSYHDHQEHLVPAAISVQVVGWDGAVVYPSYVLPWTNVLLLAGPDYVLARDSQESIR
jgi:hypothetical protein